MAYQSCSEVVESDFRPSGGDRRGSIKERKYFFCFLCLGNAAVGPEKCHGFSYPHSGEPPLPICCLVNISFF